LRLNKAELLECAISNPGELTASEIERLVHHYWLGISFSEGIPLHRANAALPAVSDDHWREVTGRLEAIQMCLYEENEAQALENIQSMMLQRRDEACVAGQEEDARKVLLYGQRRLQLLSVPGNGHPRPPGIRIFHLPGCLWRRAHTR
jgi:hypothetical protein